MPFSLADYGLGVLALACAMWLVYYVIKTLLVVIQNNTCALTELTTLVKVLQQAINKLDERLICLERRDKD
jgi:hypothetical protein